MRVSHNGLRTFLGIEKPIEDARSTAWHTKRREERLWEGDTRKANFFYTNVFATFLVLNIHFPTAYTTDAAFVNSQTVGVSSFVV